MQKTRCKECGKKMSYKWELGSDGRKKAKRIDGMNYYKASCPECGCSWYVRKKEDRVYRNY